MMALLVRMKCSSCGKTFTLYPPFALPYKRYVSPEIMGRSLRYLRDDTMTYRRATCELLFSQTNGRSPPRLALPVFYDSKPGGLAPSTVHRWSTTLGRLKKTLQAATSLLLDKGADIHRQAVDIAARKYRSEQRKDRLQEALRLFQAEAYYQVLFGRSIFPHLAIRCCWQ